MLTHKPSVFHLVFFVFLGVFHLALPHCLKLSLFVPLHCRKDKRILMAVQIRFMCTIRTMSIETGLKFFIY